MLILYVIKKSACVGIPWQQQLSLIYRMNKQANCKQQVGELTFHIPCSLWNFIQVCIIVWRHGNLEPSLLFITGSKGCWLIKPKGRDCALGMPHMKTVMSNVLPGTAPSVALPGPPVYHLSLFWVLAQQPHWPPLSFSCAQFLLFSSASVLPVPSRIHSTLQKCKLGQTLLWGQHYVHTEPDKDTAQKENHRPISLRNIVAKFSTKY